VVGEEDEVGVKIRVEVDHLGRYIRGVFEWGVEVLGGHFFMGGVFRAVMWDGNSEFRGGL